MSDPLYLAIRKIDAIMETLEPTQKIEVVQWFKYTHEQAAQKFIDDTRPPKSAEEIH